MKKIKLKNDTDDKVDGWMQTYGDMVTLLMAFFVMLFANSDPHPGKMEEMVKSFKKEFGSVEEQNEFKELNENLQKIINDKGLTENVNVALGPKGIRIKMEGNSLYNVCSADIRTDMKPVITDISTAIKELLDQSSYNDYMIEVLGHTDNQPIAACQGFTSNWGLSSIRATGVVEELIRSGIQTVKLQAIGMADSKPLMPNMDAEGNNIDENMTKNRRVEININKYTN